ncbi:MAG: CoB--CoM heterodisulfide reductase iron-sulfur subunit B family protein [Bacteroidota bacterium]
MKYAYYPGCSAESTARDQYMSIREVSKVLGIEMIEPKGWTCCGSTPAHHTDRILSLALPAANLLMAKKMGLDMVVFCAACYNRMKVANYEIQKNPDVRKEVADSLGEDYDGSVNVLHFVEVLIKNVGVKKLQEAFTHSLDGLKVANYYGCLLVRPREATDFDDPENPTIMDSLITIMGGESIDWPHKVECCGGGFAITRIDIVIELSNSILSMAKAAGAECMAVACPMCQVNLDLRQSDINKAKNSSYNIPIVYITQLVGLCLGIAPETLGMDKCVVSPRPIIEAVKSI